MNRRPPKSLKQMSLENVGLMVTKGIQNSSQKSYLQVDGLSFVSRRRQIAVEVDKNVDEVKEFLCQNLTANIIEELLPMLAVWMSDWMEHNRESHKKNSCPKYHNKVVATRCVFCFFPDFRLS